MSPTYAINTLDGFNCERSAVAICLPTRGGSRDAPGHEVEPWLRRLLSQT